MKKIGERIKYEGQWLTFIETVFDNGRGEEIIWECVKRTKPVTGVVVVPQLRPSGKFVLIKQYRPAINGYSLSFPAGLSDGDPTHALVELLEETGYHGKIVYTSPKLHSNSGVISDQAYVVFVHIDEEDEQNLNPVQNLEPQEEIEVLTVDRGDIQDLILKEQAAGTHIAGNLWYVFILGAVLNEHG